MEWYIQCAEQAFAVYSPPCLCHYLRRNIILAIIYTTLENDQALRVGPSSTTGLKPSFKAVVAHKYWCNLGFFCGLVTTGSGYFSTQSCGKTQVGNLLLLTITSEGLWPNHSKEVCTEHLRDQSQLVVLAWYAGSMTELLCRTLTLWPSPHQGVPKQPYPIKPKVI